MEGLTIIENYITEEQESLLLDNIGKPKQVSKKQQRNRILRFGSKVYDSNIVSREIPDYLKQFCKEFNSDSVTINEYFPGQFIDYHIDNENSGEVIIILSLLGNAVMNFKKKGSSFSIEVPRRSLLKMSDDLRWNWKHAIEPVKTLRYSIVFRNSR